MVVYNELGEIIEEYDLTVGILEAHTIDVRHKWVIEKKAQGEWVVIAEYPETGGRDVEFHETTPEEGRWETRNAHTNDLVLDFDGVIRDEWKGLTVPDKWTYYVYQPYTTDELKVQAEKAALEAKREQDMKELRDTIIAVLLNENPNLEGIDPEAWKTIADVIGAPREGVDIPRIKVPVIDTPPDTPPEIDLA